MRNQPGNDHDKFASTLISARLKTPSRNIQVGKNTSRVANHAADRACFSLKNSVSLKVLHQCWLYLARRRIAFQGQVAQS